MSLKLLLLSHGPRKLGTSDFPSDAGAAGVAIAVRSATATMPLPLFQAPLIIRRSPRSKVSPEATFVAAKRNLPQGAAASRCGTLTLAGREIVKSPLARPAVTPGFHSAASGGTGTMLRFSGAT